MLPSAISEDALKEFMCGSEAADVVELEPHKHVRTFKVKDEIFRLSLLENDDAIACEAMALKTVSSASQRSLVPRLMEHGLFRTNQHQYPFLRYQWVDGQTLDSRDFHNHIESISHHLYDLHHLHLFDLLHQFPRRSPPTLMKSFKLASDRLKDWMLHRSYEGLEPDLLTLSLSDIQRALRQYAVAQDHFFQTAIRPVLCHGRLTPSVIIAPRSSPTNFKFVGFEHSFLGDAASDLATMAIECNLDENTESQLLDSYLSVADSHSNTDQRFVYRYFARKFLSYLERPVQLAHEVLRIRSGESQTIKDSMVTIEEYCETIYQELVQTFNELRPFMGSARPLSIREVKAMGRITAYEELLLKGRTFRIVISGLPYSGKTQVATALAQRLDHDYVNTNSLTRAAVYLYQENKEEDSLGSLSEIFDHLTSYQIRFELLKEGPYYRVIVDDQDVTDELKSEEIIKRAAELESDSAFQKEIGDVFRHFGWSSACVMEGPGTDNLLTGKVYSFFLICDDEIREQRLRNAFGNRLALEEASTKLKALDTIEESAKSNKTIIDGKSSAASASALQILWELLPPGRRPNLENHSLSGRNLLFTI